MPNFVRKLVALLLLASVVLTPPAIAWVVVYFTAGTYPGMYLDMAMLWALMLVLLCLAAFTI